MERTSGRRGTRVYSALAVRGSPEPATKSLKPDRYGYICRYPCAPLLVIVLPLMPMMMSLMLLMLMLVLVVMTSLLLFLFFRAQSILWSTCAVHLLLEST